ncbi:transcription initiation factor IIB family protein [Halostella sp. JP-L12]|uniref:transcription initiation factor IIB family protein n=1 Tax=Halostella TaxID=1843185 RepID=UPI000EF83743|nr:MULTISPECIES: transcription initiation factor IIB family protein [Halostella]NHN48838.1 transcription initiation factor IIB family protein [Halostella sp. JP-L12]
MYRARDRVDNEEWIETLHAAADRLDLGAEPRSTAVDLFLTAIQSADGSKRTVMAASLYAGSLIAGEQRSQGAVADAADVSRLSIQQRWKEVLRTAGLEPPGW